MSERDDGGPAFPQTWHPDMMSDPTLTPAGMTLRDYFAAKALANLILFRMESTDAAHASPSIAEEAYQIADAMIKERAK